MSEHQTNGEWDFLRRSVLRSSDRQLDRDLERIDRLGNKLFDLPEDPLYDKAPPTEAFDSVEIHPLLEDDESVSDYTDLGVSFASLRDDERWERHRSRAWRRAMEEFPRVLLEAEREDPLLAQEEKELDP